MKANKGISLLICIGDYGGFHYRFTTQHWRICLGRVAFTIWFAVYWGVMLASKYLEYRFRGVKDISGSDFIVFAIEISIFIWIYKNVIK